MVADARQILHEHRVVGLDHLLVFEVQVLGRVNLGAGEVVVPVGASLDLLDLLPGDLGECLGHGLVLRLLGAGQVAVIEVEGLVVIFDLRHVGLEEHVGEGGALAHGLQLELFPVDHPAPLEALLVLPLPGVTDAGLGLDVVPPHVFGALPVGPDVLAGNGTGVAADALVQVEHHDYLGSNIHLWLLDPISVS